MTRSPEDPKGPTPKITYADYQLVENAGQVDGRWTMYQELLPTLQQHFGPTVQITFQNFESYYDRYVRFLLKA